MTQSISVLLVILTNSINILVFLLVYWSDARAAWNFRIHEQGESTRLKIYFYVTAI